MSETPAAGGTPPEPESASTVLSGSPRAQAAPALVTALANAAQAFTLYDPGTPSSASP